MDSAWDRLLELVERLAADPARPVTTDVERSLAELTTAAQQVGDIDTELDAMRASRWLAGLVTAHRAVRAAHPDVGAEGDLAELLRITTRWLHPARPR